MFKKIKNQLDQVENEYKELQIQHSQLKGLVALVMKQVGEVEIDMKNIFDADPENVKVFLNEEDGKLATVKYVRPEN